MKKIVPADAVLIPPQAQRVFKGVIYDVYHWQQPLFDGSDATFEMLRRPDTTSVIGVVDGRILVINDEQPHRGARLTFPGGRVEPTDESILAAAQRETLEETGYQFAHWRLIHAWQPHTKIEQFIHLFIAWDGTKAAEPQLDAGEKITVEPLSLAALKEKVLHKEGYLGETRDILEGVENIAGLLALPEFAGQEIDQQVKA